MDIARTVPPGLPIGAGTTTSTDRNMTAMDFVDELPPPESTARLNSLHGGPLPLIANAINGAVLLALIWGTVAPATMLGWYALLCLIIAVRAIGYRRYRGQAQPIADPRRWFFLHAAGTAATGLMWGATSALVLLVDSPSLHMLVGLTAAGMTAGALATSFASPYSFYGFATACLGPTVLAFAVHGETPYLAMAVLTAMYFVLMSLTARSLATAVFRSFRLEARLRDSVESLSDAFIVYGQDGRVLTWNSRMVEMFPYLKGKIAVGLAIREVLALAAQWPAHNLAPDERDGWIAGNLAAIGKRNGATVIELADGRTYDVRERRTAEGGWVSVFRDITEQRQAEAEMRRARAVAEEASLAKSQFLANMSHEIRTPLSGVISVLDILVNDDLTPAQRQKADMARRSADQLMEIIGDILDMSKLEAGAIRLESVAVDLAAVVDDAIQTVAARAFSKGLDIRTQIDPKVAGRYLADPTRLRQVLINLLGNAVKFTETGGVAVAVGQSPSGGGQIEFAVTDTGIGIPAGQLPLLFKKFSQADQSISRRFGGTGLGLAIAQEFVTLMGGRIAITSEPGRGSTFRFSLPLQRAGAAPEKSPDAAGAEARRTQSGLPLEGRRVLLVEDDPTNRFAGHELLARCGARVDTAEDGEVGLVKAMAERYDLILMDMQMPRLDGLTAVRRLRGVEGPNRLTPILALTANAFTDDIEQCLAAGMTAHLVKPLRRRVIETEVPKYLQPVAAEPPAPTDAGHANQCSPDALAALEADISRSGAARVVASFAAGRVTQLQELRKAWNERDIARVTLHAHSLKSIARLFGAKRLEALTVALEMNAAKISPSDGDEVIEQIGVLVNALAAELAGRYAAAA